MKLIFLIITTFLSIVACSRYDKETNECVIKKLSVNSDYAGINIQKDYCATYDEQNRLKQIWYQEIGYGDTLIVNYFIDYESNGLPLRVSRQYLKSFGGIDTIPEASIRFEYETDTLKSVNYDNVILGDIVYQKGNIKSFAYHYFDYNFDRSKYIDTTRSRKFNLETDNSGNITEVYERRLSKNYHNDVKVTYDTMPNPYCLNLLCLIPEPDFIAFFSKNNWVQMIANDDSSEIIGSRLITYNKLNYPTVIKLNHEFDHLTIDSITY